MNIKSVYFLGCPTPDGFSTNIRQDIESEDYTTYIIKGGPGTGKSSLMKKIANELSDIDAPELYYCSSDPNSLDAVVFRGLKVIIIDGTAPHVVEPEYPGVSQILVDLGSCWNVDMLADNKRGVISATVRNKKYHALVRRYLSAICSLNEDIMKIGEGSINKSKLNAYCDRLTSRLIPKRKSAPGKLCYRQITSITPEGMITHKSDFDGLTVYRIEDDHFAVADKIMKRMTDSAIASGYDVIGSKNVLHRGEVLEHIIIPELKLAFTTAESDHSAKINALRFYDRTLLKEKHKRLVFNREVAKELVSEAIYALKTAKIIHDELENYYINAMDFDKVDAAANKLIERLKMKYEKS